jgi:cyclic pyranopterin phosphate synthase
VDGIDEISMTTNGHLFTKQAERLAAAGLRRINLSLDSLDPVQFRDITRGGDLARVLEAVKTAIAVGLTPVKINAVVVKGVNEDQIEAMIDYFSLMSDFVELRFIEWMPFDGNGARRLHVPEQSLRRRIAGRYGLERSVEPVIGGGPAVGWTIPSTGLKLGFISPMTEHFCHLCNRLRLSADGNLRTCLSRENNPNIRDLLRGGASEEELGWTIRKMVFGKVAGHEVDTGVSRAFEGIMTQVGG